VTIENLCCADAGAQILACPLVLATHGGVEMGQALHMTKVAVLMLC
jgi:xanthine dehydrogenase molybdopterin-binding subunit B